MARMPTIQGNDPIQTFQLQRALLRERQGGGKADWAKALMRERQGNDPIQTFQLQRALMRERQGGGKADWAKALMQRGASTAPVQSPLEGLARMLSAGVGGYFANQARTEGEASEQEMLARLIGQTDQRKTNERAELAQAGAPGFNMPMPQPVPGEAMQVPVAPAGGGDVVMPPGMPTPPAQPPARPVNAELIAAVGGLAGQGNQTAANVLPVMQFQYQDSERKAAEARAEARAQQQLAMSAANANRETFGAPVVELVDGKPTFVRYGNLGGRQVVQGATPLPETPKPPTQAEFQRKIEEMIANGVPPQIASGLATGQIRLVTNDIDGSVRAIDMATGREIFNPDSPRQPPPVTGATPPPAVAGTTGATIPSDGVDYPGATGLPGAATSVANTIADMFGGTLPAPERERAAQALTNLATRTQMHLQTAIPGRPSNYLMEMIGGLTLRPNEITVGPQRAAERVRQTRQFVGQTIKEMEEVAGGAGQRRFSREQIAQANLALQSLRPLLADYQTLDEAFTSRGAQGGAATMGRPPLESFRR
jgi:hypothetical protein